MVPCPMCQQRMKEWQVFTHIESCPGPTPKKATPEPSINTQLSLGQLQQNKLLERLPVLNYSMLKEQALRKKLSELGLSTQGSRGMLEKRHKEWITLWNANCDAARPKKRSALLHDLDMWERTQGTKAPTNSRALQTAQGISSKEFDGSGWAQQHSDSFKDLIASARKSREAAKAKKEEEREPDNEDGEIPETPEDVASEEGNEEQPAMPNGQVLSKEADPNETAGSHFEVDKHRQPVVVDHIVVDLGPGPL